MQLVSHIGVETWAILAEMAPYLLFGFLMAGLLSVFISPEIVERHLGKQGRGSVLKAALFGIPLPLCSCGVIPVGASLRRHGASRGATTSFLISTPQTGVDSLLVTYSLLGPVFAIIRPVAALVSGLFGGGVVAALDRHGDLDGSEDLAPDSCAEDCCSDQHDRSRLYRALHYGFVTLPQDIARALLLGLLIAGLIGALVPPNMFSEYLDQGLGAMLLMLVIGIPIYVCATGSVPIAAALLVAGVSPGAVLVFLMTGPATNAAAFSTIWKVLGKRTAVIYVATVALSALASGAVLDLVISSVGPVGVHADHSMLPAWFENLSAVVLLGLLGYAILGRHFHSTAHGKDPASPKAIRLSVSGMNCNHCVNSVTRALTEMAGVDSVEVDLNGGSALVTGQALDVEALCAAVSGLGFEATPAPGSA